MSNARLTRPNTVVAPVFTIKNERTEARFSIWAPQVGQTCRLSHASCHEFKARVTPSLIYEEQTKTGHGATEVSLHDRNTWDWLQKLAQKGLDAMQAEEDAGPVQKWMVLVLVPDYAAGTIGHHTFYDSGTGTKAEAIEQVRERAAREYGLGPEAMEDIYVLLVITGLAMDVKDAADVK